MSQDHRAEIERLRVKAQQVGDLLSGMCPPEHLRHVHDTAWDLQAELHHACRRNPAIGLPGQYDSGKSLLLSLLLNMPGLLAVANVPATGNVTRVRVHPAPRCEVTGRAFTLLSPRMVGGLVDYMVGHIVDTVDGNPAYDVRGLRDRALVNVSDPAASDWEPLEEFLRPIWSDHAVNVEIRRWSTELFAIRDALRVAAHLLPRTVPGVETAIAEHDLAAALLIGDSRVPPREFPESTGYRPPLAASEMARPEGLRILLPLIHEVIIDVGLDPQVWSLSGMNADLLDFPGLDSGSLRDRFLAQSELPATTVLTVVLDAETPTNDGVHGLYSMLENGRHARPELADSLLVVANRFDRLAAPPAPAGTIAELTAASSDFRALLVEANELTRNRPDRVALTSALAGAAHANYEAPEARPQDRDTVRQAQQRWQPTLDRLAVTDPHHPLCTALDGYLADGGIAHTRALLSRHLDTHGWRILVNEALAIEAELDGTMKTLRPATAQPAATARERQRIEGLAGELTRACTRYQDRLEEVRLLRDIRIGAVTVDQRLLEEVARAVHRWHLWPPTERLATTKTAIAACRTSHSSPDLVPPPPTGRRPPAGPGAIGATTTAELLVAYHETRKDLADPAVRLLEDALRQWSATLLSDKDFQRAAERLGGPKQPWTEDRTLLYEWLALVNAPEWLDYRLRLIDALLSPDLLADRTRSVVADQFRPGPADGTAPPLSPNRALPWHPHMLANDESGGLADFADPMIVFRLRRDLVLALHREISRCLQNVLDTVSDEMQTFLARFAEDAVPTPEEIRRMTLPTTGDDT